MIWLRAIVSVPAKKKASRNGLTGRTRTLIHHHGMLSEVALYPNRERTPKKGCSIANRVGRPKEPNASSRPFICQMNWILLLFPDNYARIFVVAHGDEFDMADMVRICPFKEVESGNKFRPHPQCRMPDYAECIWAPELGSRLLAICTGVTLILTSRSPTYGGTGARLSGQSGLDGILNFRNQRTNRI